MELLVVTKYEMLSHCKIWSGQRGSNPRPSAWEANALPLSYARSHKINGI